MNDINRIITILDLLRFRGHTYKSIATEININLGTLYYIRSTRRASNNMCFYIDSKLKELYPTDYEDAIKSMEE